jgi:predicted Zn-dependent protease
MHASDLEAHFDALATTAQGLLRGAEGYTLSLAAETTDFVRFNHGRVRQPGQVRQIYLHVQWLRGLRHVSAALSLSGTSGDHSRLQAAVGQLRGALDEVPEDPYLLLNTTPQSSRRITPNTLIPTEAMVEDIVSAAGGEDLVGILAAGPICNGFANHLGQRNWHATRSWNFDWSLYTHTDKAVKAGSAGFAWDRTALQVALDRARVQLKRLAAPAKSLSPGRYRAYLTPAALSELLGTLNWGGFSEKEVRAKRSGLMRMHDGAASLSPLVTLFEDTAGGLAPDFQAEGFIKPERVTLIDAGRAAARLVSPRTAKEYGLASNGASAWESAESQHMVGGALPMTEALAALDTGLYIGNLHYLNYADRAAGRLTGMTRFACFWVERGEIVAPLNVMRFDDSIYRMLGSELEALTRETEFMADPSTYNGARSAASQRLPGALLSSFNLVL